MSNDIDSDNSDMSIDRISNQDISSDDESSTNESISDSNDDIIPVIMKSKALTSISTGIPFFFNSPFV